MRPAELCQELFDEVRYIEWILSEIKGEPEQELYEEELYAMLKRLGRDINIIMHRHGDDTLESIGEMAGITRERVRQVEAGAIKKLKHPRGGIRKVKNNYLVFRDSGWSIEDESWVHT